MSSSAAEVVKTTTGILFRLGSSLISSRTSRPLFLGRFRSNKIRSGRGTLAYFPRRHRKFVASIPSEAICRVFCTSRISMVLEFISSPLRPRNRKHKRRSFSGLCFHPDLSSVAFHDLSANGQADARARILLGGVQALKHLKDTFGILWSDADSVVLNGKEPLVTVWFGSHMDFRRAFVAVFDGVPNQVLEQLHKLPGICEDWRQGPDVHYGVGILDRRS